ncbi:MAG: hypothetical protein QHJ73_16535, partial [Armatimonadota bacterium]|nr:hypothetical protein [Armatimonadota bacterium]
SGETVMGGLARLALALAALVAVRLAAGTALPAPAPKDESQAPTKERERTLKISAPNGTAVYSESTRTYIITFATVELPDSDAVLRADRIEYNEEENWVRATGKPRLWDRYNELTADMLRADMDAKSAEATGNVRLVTRPKEAQTEAGRKARERIKEPLTVLCDRMVYFYKEKRGTATGNLRITQKDKRGDRVATGERLSYDGNEETITLEGKVRVTNTRGEGFNCSRVIITFKEGAEGFEMEGLEHGTFFVKEKSEEPATNRENTPAPAPAAVPEGGAKKEEPGPTP